MGATADHVSAWGPREELDRHVLQFLLDGPDRVRNALGSVLATKELLAAAERDLDLLRARVRIAVSDETVTEVDAKGAPRIRPKYGNDTARNDETLLRLAMDPDAAAVEARLMSARRGIDQATIGLEYERARLDAARAAARILGGRT